RASRRARRSIRAIRRTASVRRRPRTRCRGSGPRRRSRRSRRAATDRSWAPASVRRPRRAPWQPPDVPPGVCRGEYARDGMWPALNYGSWSATCDTLHAHTQVLGKLAVELAPPEPQLQHAALRLTARGWETRALPAPDGSGAIVAALDLHAHAAVIEHSGGDEARIALTHNRPVAEVTRDVLAAVERLAGRGEINPAPQEVWWQTPLDEDYEHATYDADQVATYFEAATHAALALWALRAPFRGRSTQVNAWWGTFDLAVNFFSGRPADPPSDDFIMRNGGDAQQISVGWWPGDPNHQQAA